MKEDKSYPSPTEEEKLIKERKKKFNTERDKI